MATAASIAMYGRTELWINFGSGLVQIPDIISSVSVPGEASTIEVTHNSSPSQTAEFIKGMKKSGKISVEINYLPTNTVCQSILADYNSDAASTNSRACEVVFNTTPAKKCTFNAFVIKAEPVGDMNKQLVLKFDLQITGAITWPT